MAHCTRTRLASAARGARSVRCCPGIHARSRTQGSAYWHISNNVVDRVPEWLHIWTPSIHDEVVVENWSNQQYQIVHGTNCTVQDNIFIAVGTPFPAAAQAVINAAGVSWQHGPKT